MLVWCPPQVLTMMLCLPVPSPGSLRSPPSPLGEGCYPTCFRAIPQRCGWAWIRWCESDPSSTRNGVNALVTEQELWQDLILRKAYCAG